MDIPKVIKFNEDGKLFLRAFLIDGSVNENDWGVVSSTISRNIKTFINMPLVLDENYDHPKWKEELGIAENAEYQQKFAIGTIRDVVEKGGKWDAIIEITDPLAKEAIEKEDIPFYVSPRILHDSDQPDEAIKDWQGFHLAIVDEPAFGDKAKIKGACYGMAAECQIALKNAKKEPCGFCVKKALEKLVTKQGGVISSINLPSKKNTSMEDCPDKKQSQTTEEHCPEKSQAQEQEKECAPREEIEALKAKIAAMTGAFEQARQAYDSRIAAVEEEKKEEKISSVLSAKIADKEELAKKVKYFMDAKVAPEVVAEAFKLVPDIHTTKTDSIFNARPADASVNQKAGSFDAWRRYNNSVIGGVSL